jgi:hypothetical protein
MDATVLITLFSVVGASIVSLTYFGEQRTKKLVRERMHAKFAEFANFAEQLQQARAMPFIADSPLECQKGEFVVLSCDSMMYGYRGELICVSELFCEGPGALYLTNQRLAFVGPQKTFTTPFGMLQSMDNAGEWITVRTGGLSTPVIFSVPNGYFWCGLATLLTKVTLHSPQLPDAIGLFDLNFERFGPSQPAEKAVANDDSQTAGHSSEGRKPLMLFDGRLRDSAG